MPVLRFMSLLPNCDAGGDTESTSLLAGQGVGLVREVNSADQIVQGSERRDRLSRSGWSVCLQLG
jgi:hypothetical protein